MCPRGHRKKSVVPPPLPVRENVEEASEEGKGGCVAARSSGFNIGNGENKHGHRKEEIWKYCRGKGIRRAGIRRPGDGNIRSYTIPLLSLFFFSLFLEHCKQWTETKCGKGGWRVERSSLENVQRRGKLNLFGRLSGMDSSKSSRSRLMRFSAITPAKSNEFFFLSFFWLESPGGKFFCPI